MSGGPAGSHSDKIQHRAQISVGIAFSSELALTQDPRANSNAHGAESCRWRDPAALNGTAGPPDALTWFDNLRLCAGQPRQELAGLSRPDAVLAGEEGRAALQVRERRLQFLARRLCLSPVDENFGHPNGRLRVRSTPPRPVQPV